MSLTREMQEILDRNTQEPENVANLESALTKKKAFQLYNDDVESLINNFSPEEIGTIFIAISKYAIYGEEAETFSDRACDIAYKNLVSALKRNNEKYLLSCQKKKKAVEERWKNEKNKNL